MAALRLALIMRRRDVDRSWLLYAAAHLGIEC